MACSHFTNSPPCIAHRTYNCWPRSLHVVRRSGAQECALQIFWGNSKAMTENTRSYKVVFVQKWLETWAFGHYIEFFWRHGLGYQGRKERNLVCDMAAVPARVSSNDEQELDLHVNAFILHPSHWLSGKSPLSRCKSLKSYVQTKLFMFFSKISH